MERFALGLVARFIILAAICAPANADDTAAIQGILDAPRLGAVEFPAGVFDVGPLAVGSAVKFITGKTVVSIASGTLQVKRLTLLRLVANAGAWARVLNVPRTPSDRTLEIYDLRFDMNRSNQGWQGGHDLEHQAAIFLGGESGARLTVTIAGLEVLNSAGDGVYVHHCVTLDISDYQATDVFRGSLMITGKACIVRAAHCRWLRAGLDIEPNNVSDNVDVMMDRVEILGKFDIAMYAGSRFVGTAIRHTGGPLYLYCDPGASFTVADFLFSGMYEIRLPGRCYFTAGVFQGLVADKPVVDVEWTRKGYVFAPQLLSMTGVQVLGPGRPAIDAGTDYVASGDILRLTRVQMNGTAGAVVATKGRKATWEFTDVTDDGKPVTP